DAKSPQKTASPGPFARREAVTAINCRRNCRRLHAALAANDLARNVNVFPGRAGSGGGADNPTPPMTALASKPLADLAVVVRALVAHYDSEPEANCCRLGIGFPLSQWNCELRLYFGCSNGVLRKPPGENSRNTRSASA